MTQLSAAVNGLLELDASPEQKAYMLAKALHETVRRGAAREKEAITVPRPTRAEIAAMIDERTREEAEKHPYFLAADAIDERYQVHEIWRQLLHAENQLVAWAEKNGRRLFTPEQFARIAVGFERWPLCGELRDKLLDICVRMAVAK